MYVGICFFMCFTINALFYEQIWITTRELKKKTFRNMAGMAKLYQLWSRMFVSRVSIDSKFAFFQCASMVHIVVSTPDWRSEVAGLYPSGNMIFKFF